jgi:hypothetical protein
MCLSFLWGCLYREVLEMPLAHEVHIVIHVKKLNASIKTRAFPDKHFTTNIKSYYELFVENLLYLHVRKKGGVNLNLIICHFIQELKVKVKFSL